jgi:hypothetical protein
VNHASGWTLNEILFAALYLAANAGGALVVLGLFALLLGAASS